MLRAVREPLLGACALAERADPSGSVPGEAAVEI